MDREVGAVSRFGGVVFRVGVKGGGVASPAVPVSVIVVSFHRHPVEMTRQFRHVVSRVDDRRRRRDRR